MGEGDVASASSPCRMYNVVHHGSRGAPARAVGRDRNDEPGVRRDDERRVADLCRRSAWHRYSPAAQINATNFNKLEVAWRFKTDSLGPRPEYKLEGTPLMVNGVLYATAGTRRAVVALDAATGELLWVHGEHEGARGARLRASCRVAGWRTGPTARRSASSTSRQAIASLRSMPRPALRVPASAENGIVDLKQGAMNDADHPIRPRHRRNRSSFRAGRDEGHRDRRRGVPRRLRHPRRTTTTKATFAHTTCAPASELWIFHTIPRPGEFEQRHVAERFAGLTTATPACGPDDRGRRTRTGLPAGGIADRRLLRRPPSRGNNLFGESLVCVDLKNRPAEMALPAGAPSALGHGHFVGADPGRHQRQRASDQGRRAADEAGLPLRLRSRDGPAGVADRRAPGREGQRSRRVVFADAADSHQAACIQPQRRHRRRSDRLHARRCGRRQ